MTERVATSVRAGKDWLQGPKGPYRPCRAITYVSKGEANPDLLDHDSFRKMCAGKGLVVEVAGDVKYDDRTSTQQQNDEVRFKASKELKGESVMAKKKDLMDIEALEGLFDGMDDGWLGAALDKERLTKIGLVSAVGGGAGALLAWGLPKIPTGAGNMAYLNRLLPFGAGLASWFLLQDRDSSLAAAALASGATASGILLVDKGFDVEETIVIENGDGSTTKEQTSIPPAAGHAINGRLSELMGLLGGPVVNQQPSFQAPVVNDVPSFQAFDVETQPAFQGLQTNAVPSFQDFEEEDDLFD